MINLKSHLAAIISAGVSEIYSVDLGAEEVSTYFEYPPDSTMGDLAFPCFKLSRALHDSPVNIASKLSLIDFNGYAFSSVSGGYLNFKVSSNYLVSDVLVKAEKLGEKYGAPTYGKGKTVVLDYSSPNVAKPFHIGHLGTTVIGHSLKLLHEFAGFDCIGINYLGDWGTQFGKLLVAYRKWGSKDEIESQGIDALVALYVKFHAEAEADDSLNQQARDEFKKLEMHDSENINLWKWFIEISLAEYKKTYRQLGIEFDSYAGESFYTDKMPEQVNLLRDKGMLKIDDGASIVDLSDYNMPPCLILKKDGSTLYPTRDIAAAVYRKRTYNFDKCIYVTSAGQSLHFAQWFKVVEMMGYDWYDELVHVPYGTVSIGGEKLATRTGNVVLLKDLFSQAIEKVSNTLDEKNTELDNREEVCESVGVGAVVFHYLFNTRIKDINFIMDDALSFEGNTGPYAQYTYARICSILNKANEIDFDEKANISTQEEIDLLLTLSKFEEKVNTALKEYEPSVIARYIIELSGAFNRFYHNCPVNNAENKEIKNTRLRIAKATGGALKKALSLICIKTPEKI